MPTQTKPFVIALTDNKDGHKNQLLAVLQQLKQDYAFNNQLILSSSTRFGFLSILLLLLGCNVLVNKSIKIWAKNFCKNIDNNKNNNLYKNVLILSVGKKTLAGSLYIKFLLLKLGISVKLVYLMPPTKLFNKYIDLQFFHNYKKQIETNKQIGIIAPPNLVALNLQNIAKEQENKTTFVVAVLIGGDAKNIVFNKHSVDALLKYLKLIENALTKTGFNCKLLISTSRRTDKLIEQYLAIKLQEMLFSDYTFYGFHINPKLAKDKYLFILKQANCVIVTGESVSMISESCSLNNNVGVYIFFNKDFYAKRYKAYHTVLYKMNYAYKQDQIFDHINNFAPQNTNLNFAVNRKVLNTTSLVAEKINCYL